MPGIHSVAVFCGAYTGTDPAFMSEAEHLGRALAHAGLRLIFGGGSVGLMGAMAAGALRAGGSVVGVIPEFLTRREVAHEALSELIVTDSMHSRKLRMFELADAFVSFAGGLGTLDETFEILTWRQLHLHDKPILICDIAGSAGPLIAAVDAVVAAGFASADTRMLFELVHGVPALIQRLTELPSPQEGSTSRL